jgi:hypothetical protein
MADVPRDPHKAINFMIENAGGMAAAKGERVYLEQFRKSKKALLMNASTAKTIAEREADAYSHPEYIQLLEGLRVAVEREEQLKWMLTAAEARVELYRTESANARAQDRAAQ